MKARKLCRTTGREASGTDSGVHYPLKWTAQPAEGKVENDSQLVLGLERRVTCATKQKAHVIQNRKKYSVARPNSNRPHDLLHLRRSVTLDVVSLLLQEHRENLDGWVQAQAVGTLPSLPAVDANAWLMSSVFSVSSAMVADLLHIGS